MPIEKDIQDLTKAISDLTSVLKQQAGVPDAWANASEPAAVQQTEPATDEAAPVSFPWEKDTTAATNSQEAANDPPSDPPAEQAAPAEDTSQETVDELVRQMVRTGLRNKLVEILKKELGGQKPTSLEDQERVTFCRAARAALAEHQKQAA